MKKLLLFVLSALLLVACTACLYDGPPKEDTSDPPALDGVFVCDDSTLTFNGDGKTVTMKLDDAFAARTGLPAGETTCQYVFLLSNGGLYRYDKAETLEFYFDETGHRFRNALGTTGETVVAFYPKDDADTFVQFEKS